MKRIILCLALSLGLTTISLGQNKSLNNRQSFKLGYSNTPELANWSSKLMSNNLWLEGNYGYNNFLESGIYLGYTNYTNYDATTGLNQNIQTYISNAFFYGVNTNLQILPLLKLAQEPRLDLYISGKVGLLSFVSPKESALSGSSFDARFYMGASYFLFSKLGLYAEYGFSKKVKQNGFEPGYRLGIAIKL